MIDIKVTGFTELEQALRQLPEEIAGKTLASALRTASQPIATHAKETAVLSDHPSKVGHMADSIKVRALKEETVNDLESSFWIGPDRKHFYGLFWEFGTRHQRARPFLRPAWDEGKDRALDSFGKALWTAIERAAKRLARGA